MMMNNTTSSSSHDHEMMSSQFLQTSFNHCNDHNLPTKKMMVMNPRKKRTKLMRIDNSTTAASTSSNVVSVAANKPKHSKKPDPSAPKISRPCTECGKRFWSVKALFGHMRCHPERQWRGINPPPNIRRPSSSNHHCIADDRWDQVSSMTEEDQHVASCLLSLANAPPRASSIFSDQTNPTCIATSNAVGISDLETRGHQNEVFCGNITDHRVIDHKFECSSCKKVFGSHQALGGHRASHKNVKGCFAINKSIDGTTTEEDYSSIGGPDHINVDHGGDHDQDKMLVALGHRCSICLRVFSSGQALGGHKRCHWEMSSSLRQEGPGLNQQYGAKGASAMDLNLSMPLEDDHSSSSLTSGLCLDLRLGL